MICAHANSVGHSHYASGPWSASAVGGFVPTLLFFLPTCQREQGSQNFTFMKKQTKWILGVTAFMLMTGWAYYHNGYQHDKAKKQVKKELSVNPDVQTDYGQLGDYRTMDEYYMDGSRKVYHGYRKNLYASGSARMVSYYEHGKLLWTEEYDQAGNVTSSNR